MDVPLLQYSDTTVDRKQHEDCMTKYNEIKMDKKLRSAKLWTENKKQTVFDREGPRDLRFRVRYKRGAALYVVCRRSSRARSMSQGHCRLWKRPSQ